MLDKNKLNKIGERIKKERKIKKFTQASLAQKVWLQKSAISKIETNKQSATIEQLLNISNALDIRIEYLLDLDTALDKETRFVRDFIKSFNRITTTRKYSANNDGIFNGKDLIFETDEEYLVLVGNECLFALIKEIADVENQKSELSEENYIRIRNNAIKRFKKNKAKGNEKSYFLISGEQITELIETAVIDREYVETLLKKIKDE